MAADALHTSNRVASNIEDGMERTGEKLQQAGEHIRGKASEVAHNISELGGRAARSAQEGLSQFRDSASQYMHMGREQVKAVGDSFQGQIQTRPISSILIAAGVGFLLGVFLMRRS
jgi:ElaB/YqjD/DUF883 family membrane-anchored ribosome-binding protein